MIEPWPGENWAVLYYTSCWDFVGIKIEIVGMDPNCQLIPGLLSNIVTTVFVSKVSKVPNMFKF